MTTRQLIDELLEIQQEHETLEITINVDGIVLNNPFTPKYFCYKTKHLWQEQLEDIKNKLKGE